MSSQNFENMICGFVHDLDKSISESVAAETLNGTFDLDADKGTELENRLIPIRSFLVNLLPKQDALGKVSGGKPPVELIVRCCRDLAARNANGGVWVDGVIPASFHELRQCNEHLARMQCSDDVWLPVIEVTVAFYAVKLVAAAVGSGGVVVVPSSYL